MAKFKVSQSLMKSFFDYLSGKECGLYFKARYIDKDPYAFTPPSDAMKLGNFFEYKALGSKLRDGSIPQAEYVYKGKPNEQLSAEYRRAAESAEVFKRVMADNKIKILETQVTLEDDKKKGVLDAIIEFNGRTAILDTKYSGLIDNKWDEKGWDLDSLHMKEAIMVQPVHYKILARDVLNVQDMPFYFYVASSADVLNVKFIEVRVDPSRIEAHIQAIDRVIEMINAEIKKGFGNKADMTVCNKCPLNSKCPKATKLPKIHIINF